MSSNTFVNPNLAAIPTLPSPNPQVRAFHKSLPHYEPTPLVSLAELASQLGVRYVLLKDESSRLALPAFKIVGASWATARKVSKRLGLAADPMLPLAAMSTQARLANLTLYAATDGNHGRAVARMAKYLGTKAKIYVPDFCDEAVKNNIRGEGAEVIVCNGSYDDAVLVTKTGAESHPNGNGLLISDTALVAGDEVAQWIVDGYQTIFDEIEEQIVHLTNAPITHVLTPVGVGSLCQAVVTHFRRETRPRKPDIITVEPEVAACLKSSLEAGEMVSIDVGYTICSGMCCGTVSANAWPFMKNGVNTAMTIDDISVEKALFELDRHGVAAGPCGASTTAALRTLKGLEKDSVILLLCTEGPRTYEMAPIGA